MKIELTREQWGVVLQAVHNTPTQDLNTASQLMQIMQEMQTQLLPKETDNGTSKK
jgi:hypothetical protein